MRFLGALKSRLINVEDKECLIIGTASPMDFKIKEKERKKMIYTMT